MDFRDSPNKPCRLHYETHGDPAQRPPVIFLNGTLQTTLNWLPVAKPLSKQCAVLLYDARGQGQSDPGDRPLSRELHAADLLSLMDRLDIPSARLVGISHGAQVACAIAATAPDRVDGMLLCGAAAEPTARTRLILKSWPTVLKEGGLKALVWAALPCFFGDRFLEQNERMIDGMAKAMIRRNSAASLAAHLEAISAYGPLKDLAADIRCPVTVMTGAEDALAPPESAQALAAALRGRFIEVPETGHSLPAEAPEAFRKALEGMIGA